MKKIKILNINSWEYYHYEKNIIFWIEWVSPLKFQMIFHVFFLYKNRCFNEYSWPFFLIKISGFFQSFAHYLNMLVASIYGLLFLLLLWEKGVWHWSGIGEIYLMEISKITIKKNSTLNPQKISHLRPSTQVHPTHLYPKPKMDSRTSFSHSRFEIKNS
jgi:hypothetical protein